MKSIQTRTTINAPAHLVWETLMNFDNYPTWNPLILSLSGEAKVNSELQLHIQPPNQKGMQFQPKVLIVDPNQEFRWKGKLLIPGLFDGEHYFQLRELNGKTELIHGEKFSGLLSSFIFAKIGDSTLAGFEMMNHALKQHVESK